MSDTARDLQQPDPAATDGLDDLFVEAVTGEPQEGPSEGVTGDPLIHAFVQEGGPSDTTRRLLDLLEKQSKELQAANWRNLGAQLGIDVACLPMYLERRDTRMEHALEIKTRQGYKNFGTQPEHWRLLRWLYERAWLTSERPSVLFDLATARLVDNKILLPGVTTCAN